MKYRVLLILLFAVNLGFGQIYIDSYRFASAAPTNLLLDDYPGATAAYSLRKLDKDYTGSAIQIQRVFPAGITNIGFNSNNDLDVAAINNYCSGTTCTVLKWYDQSGNGNDLTTSGSNQPTIYASGSIQTSSSKPALNFDGSNDYLLKLALNISQPFSVFMAFEEKSRAVTNAIFDGSNLRSTILASSNDNNIYVNSGSSTSGGTLSIAPHIVSSVHNSSSSYLNVDGINRLTNANIGTNGIGNLAIGFNLGGNQLAYANMYFQEFIIYPSNQLLNVSNIENNINSYYSIY